MRALALLAILSAATPTMALADDAAAANQQDFRCMAITLMGLGLAKKPAEVMGLAAGVGFYMGRIRGRSPSSDIEVGLRAQIPGLKGEILRSESQRCGEEMKDFGSELSAIGASMVSSPDRSPET